MKVWTVERLEEKRRRTREAHKAQKILGDVGYGLLLQAQNWRCAVCECHMDSINTRFCIDHDHESMAIRGLLCRSCNRWLGTHEAGGFTNKREAFERYLANPPARGMNLEPVPDSRVAHPKRPPRTWNGEATGY